METTQPKPRTAEPKFLSTEQIAHFKAGGLVYGPNQLVDALDRRDKGRATRQDKLQLSLIPPGYLEGHGWIRAILDGRRSERRRIKEEIEEHGPDRVQEFMEATGQLPFLRSIGVRFRAPVVRQGHAPQSGSNQHHKGSRRSSSSETSGSDPGEPSGEPEPAQGDERLCVGCSTSIAHKAKQARFCTSVCETRHRRAEKRLLADRPTQPGNEPAAKAAASTPRRAADPYLESPLHDPWHLKRTKMRAEGLGVIDEGDRPRERDLAGVAPLPAAAGHIEGQARQSSTRPDERARVEQYPSERVVSASARRRALAERSLREAGAGKRRSPELSVPIVGKPPGRLKGLATVVSIPDLLSSRRRHTGMVAA